MKKTFFVFIFCVIVSLSVSAQGFYFDIGAGSGLINNKVTYDYDTIDLSKIPVRTDHVTLGDFPYKDEPYNFFATGMGLKAGFGPFGNVPLYVVSDVGFFADVNVGLLIFILGLVPFAIP